MTPETGRMVVLIKPQFEVRRDQVGEGELCAIWRSMKISCAKVRACVEESNFTTQIA